MIKSFVEFENSSHYKDYLKQVNHLIDGVTPIEELLEHEYAEANFLYYLDCEEDLVHNMTELMGLSDDDINSCIHCIHENYDPSVIYVDLLKNPLMMIELVQMVSEDEGLNINVKSVLFVWNKEPVTPIQ